MLETLAQTALYVMENFLARNISVAMSFERKKMLSFGKRIRKMFSVRERGVEQESGRHSKFPSRNFSKSRQLKLVTICKYEYDSISLLLEKKPHHLTTHTIPTRSRFVDMKI